MTTSRKTRRLALFAQGRRRAPGGLARRLEDWLENVWSSEAPGGLPRWLLRTLQLGVVIAEGFVRDRLLLRASALTYVSMLSLVPLLAIAVSLVQAIGVREDLAGLLVGRIAAGSPEAGERILELVRSVRFGALGTLGTAALFVTTLLAIGNVERALNQIWGVKRQRTWTRRVADYLAVLVVAPTLLAVALSLMTMVQSQALVQHLLQFPPFELAYEFGLRYVPIGVLAAAFTFLYLFLPNTQVRFGSALLGGVIAALLFSLAQYAYVGFNVGVTRYDSVFGGFALLPLLLVWIYISWAIVLLGAEVAFAHQNLDRYRREVRGVPAGAADREALGLLIAIEVARCFRDGAPPWTASALSEALDAPVRSVREVLSALERAGWVHPLQEEDREERFALGRPAERIPVVDLLHTLRGARDARLAARETGKLAAELLAELDRVELEATAGRTLADILERLPAAALDPDPKRE